MPSPKYKARKPRPKIEANAGATVSAASTVLMTAGISWIDEFVISNTFTRLAVFLDRGLTAFDSNPSHYTVMNGDGTPQTITRVQLLGLVKQVLAFDIEPDNELPAKVFYTPPGDSLNLAGDAAIQPGSMVWVIELQPA